MTTPKRVTILGATGSIGQSTLDLIRQNPEAFDVIGLTAHRSVTELARSAREFNADCAAIADATLYDDLKQALAGTSIEAAAGEGAVTELASRPSDYVMAGIVGSVGLRPTLAAVRTGTCVAFANKECLVSAGPLMMQEVGAHGATLLPVDSEHNAIFQVFESHNRAAITRLILTASGGPFRTWDMSRMAAATPSQAVAHPNWNMGAKISVDSASMMNKGLELIEAHYLFDIPEAQIEIVVHPQSIIHSMVEYADGSVLAQLGPPDMRTPIANTLAWPGRMSSPSDRLDFLTLARLDFEAPDQIRFPSLRLAREALQAGAHAPTIMNAANEEAVAAFLGGRCGFSDIPRTVEATLDAIAPRALDTLDDVFDLEGEARAKAQEHVAVAAE